MLGLSGRSSVDWELWLIDRFMLVLKKRLK
jgi:hypothetical protein